MPSNWKTAVSPKEVLDLSKDITMIIEGKNGATGFYVITLGQIDRAITKSERQIKLFEMLLDKIDSGLSSVILENKSDLMREIAVKQKHNGNVKRTFELEVQREKEYIELFKIKKLIYTSLVKEKDLSKLGDLLLTKMRTSLSNALELTEEFVSLGRLKEKDYMDDANDAREVYDTMEEQIKLYNHRKDMIITNMKIQVIRQ
jgi:hypothetical protein